MSWENNPGIIRNNERKMLPLDRETRAALAPKLFAGKNLRNLPRNYPHYIRTFLQFQHIKDVAPYIPHK